MQSHEKCRGKYREKQTRKRREFVSDIRGIGGDWHALRHFEIDERVVVRSRTELRTGRHYNAGVHETATKFWAHFYVCKNVFGGRVDSHQQQALHAAL